ncbi:NRX1A-like protein [Mya arenaria]|uniref:NRX1A-like protein n=1 Tax=Mya arenaria TaxID=6604 RepID=A0ABY7EPU8_MYAAR|nr:NRX1A-like protein [Mya arenaria]
MTHQTVQCQPNACGPGVCVPRVNDFWCDCNMTGLVGIPCTTNPNGYYFGKNGQGGVVVYEFPQHKQVNSNTDMLAFGFKTLEKDGVLYRIESSLDNNEYIEIRLENGTVVAEANTGSGLVRLVENSRVFNDGQYHVVRYIRTGGNSTLQVDQLPTQLAVNKSVVSLFNSVYRVMLGGRIDSKGAIIRNFYGIIGGAYYNGHRWLDLLLSNTALHGKLVNMRGDVVLTKTYLLLPGGGKTSPVPPDLIINPAEKVPVNVGGGAEIGTGVGGVGDGGTPPRVPSFGETGGHFSSLGSGISVGAVPHAAPVEVTRAGGPIMPGARAGAVVGTVLGTMAFLTSLMWALYKLKPGVPTFLSPGAGAAEDDADISISSPRPTSNLGAVKAASAGAGGAGGEAGGAGAGALTVTVVDGSAADGGGAGGGNSTYLSYIKSTSTSISGGGAGGGAGAGGAGGADVTDFSTLMSTVTFSNIGTAIGSPTADRRITSSSYSSNLNYQSNTMQQELSQFSAGDDDFPDYDIPLGGTGEVTDQSYSFSTLNTNYNYQPRQPPTRVNVTNLCAPEESFRLQMGDCAQPQGVPAPPSLFMKLTVSENSSSVTLHTSGAPHASYSNRGNQKMPGRGEFIEIRENRKTSIRKSSLQVPAAGSSKAGYQRLENSSSETNVKTFKSETSRTSTTTHIDDSRDDLFKSTTTIISNVRSDSMDTGLFGGSSNVRSDSMDTVLLDGSSNVRSDSMDTGLFDGSSNVRSDSMDTVLLDGSSNTK